ncbi:hypothetical protein DRQ15_00815 [candidate division KSB1 bacterium]|nr:MAG: hypothetical protein DRQ15_00815 [candidate division KSB1 bacterium]
MITKYAQARGKRYPIVLLSVMKSVMFLLCATVILGLSGCKQSSTKETEVQTRIDNAQVVYEKLLKATSLGQKLLYDNNLTGRIVWNEAQFMESLLNMYEATKDRKYLAIFVKHADHVLRVRDDRAGRSDYAGRLRPGWQVGGYYTLGIPIIIPDDKGNPALEIQGIHQAGNNHTVVEIIREDSEHFTLLVRNDFRCKEPLEVTFKGITLETVERTVNADLSPNSWIRVRVVGSAPPASGVYPLKETYKMVLHELHTPIIGIPFLRFADLVFRTPELAIYQSKAREYVQAFEQSFQDYSSSWREDAEGGYFVFEPGGKYWASGLPVPYNGLSANGRFLLWLWRVTGNVSYLEKAVSLARKVRAGITFLPDGTVSMPYWIKDSLPYNGWENRDSDPVNGIYSRSDANHSMEDVSHFSLTLHFMIDAWQMGVVFQEDDLKAVARTFTKRLWKPLNAKAEELCNSDWRKGFYLAHNLDGEGRAYDYAVSAFARLARWEPSILEHAQAVYESRYKDINCLDVDYLYGEVMLGWSILALKDELLITTLREKPLYPFTLRVSAEEYVRSSRLVSLDEHGVPVTDYGSLHGEAGRRYNPTFIANYALALYRDYLATKDSSLLQAFQKQVQWFLEHRTRREYHGVEFWVWEFDFDNPSFKAKTPWVSALSQGRILCTFLAAYDLTGNLEYLRAAEYAFRSFVVPTSAGGVATFEGNTAWYEEVADEEAPSAKILNGHIAAVQALWTFWKWTGRANVRRYLDLGIAAVKRDIALYDAGFLSFYSQYPTNPREYAPARDYNTLHVHQLLWLYEVSGDPVFLKYALQFARYDAPGWEITTAGSTDPVGHGPENLFFQMFSKYWSHNQFPTWIQLDLKEPQLIEGVVLFGYTPKATPRDFQVFVSKDGKEWSLVLKKIGNEKQHIIQRFKPLFARFVKIVILKDNGNNNVALTGVAVLRKQAIPMAVCNWASFSSRNLPILVFGQGWKVPEKGWIIIDLGERLPRVL